MAGIYPGSNKRGDKVTWIVIDITNKAAPIICTDREGETCFFEDQCEAESWGDANIQNFTVVEY